MKTLVITGAARKNGHTNQMVKLFLDTLGGEYTIIDAYRAENIAPLQGLPLLLAQEGLLHP